MTRLALALPLLVASEVAAIASDHLFNLGAIVAGSHLRKGVIA